ncbi:uncharacterized protein LOC111024573 [Momordica charantia]|uniref:Uncharacterized protein LOC111024573 n=1 Tax=Momordica charantia TaxID=3673 RepID=A0A6J1DUI4_MOMCH|nr:uncharacterized protein LOC111024573 [Momordica charantia]
MPNAARASRDAYERWIKANDKVKVYTLASISDVLVKKHESMVTVREIMDLFRYVFGQLSIQTRHDALKFIYNSCMNEETSVREHVLNLMVHFNVAEVNGVVIDEGSQVTLSWNLFRRVSYSFAVLL